MCVRNYHFVSWINDCRLEVITNKSMRASIRSSKPNWPPHADRGSELSTRPIFWHVSLRLAHLCFRDADTAAARWTSDARPGCLLPCMANTVQTRKRYLWCTVLVWPGYSGRLMTYRSDLVYSLTCQRRPVLWSILREPEKLSGVIKAEKIVNVLALEVIVSRAFALDFLNK